MRDLVQSKGSVEQSARLQGVRDGWARSEADASPIKRYVPALLAAAAGWSLVEIAYFDWNLIPQSLPELGAVLFGAAAGGSGALAILLSPEEA